MTVAWNGSIMLCCNWIALKTTGTHTQLMLMLKSVQQQTWQFSPVTSKPEPIYELRKLEELGVRKDVLIHLEPFDDIDLNRTAATHSHQVSTKQFIKTSKQAKNKRLFYFLQHLPIFCIQEGMMVVGMELAICPFTGSLATNPLHILMLSALAAHSSWLLHIICASSVDPLCCTSCSSSPANCKPNPNNIIILLLLGNSHSSQVYSIFLNHSVLI